MHTIKTIDVHTAGEPLRIVTSGFPELPGDTILAKRRFATEHHDDLRRALMWEPRGHADMYGCVPVEPVTDDGDVGVLFLHNEGFSTMCGHGIIGFVKAALQCGLLPAVEGENAVRIDTPAGRVTARAELRGDSVGPVTFSNVPSFLLEADFMVDVEGLGTVMCDIAFGGAFYAYVDAAAVGVSVEPGKARRIIDVGMAIKRAVMESYAIEHPDGDPDLEFLYGVILHERGTAGADLRNACVFADGELDRCPTGTGVSGRAAIEHAFGRLATGESLRIASILDTKFDVRVAATQRVGKIPAIVPEVTGSAFVTGHHEFVIDPNDPLRHGFLLDRE